MTRLLVASCVAAACSVGLSAQAPTGGSKPQSTPAAKEQPAQKSSQADEKSAVVRGCLRAGDTAGTYVLADATATSGGTLKNATVQLVGTPSGANLKDHVGHTVEVTGSLDAAGAASSGAAGTTGAAGATGTAAAKPGATAGTAGAGAAKAKLNVKTIKHVKETCGA